MRRKIVTTFFQELGASNSSYSLSNQLKLNPIFDSGENKVTFEDIKQFVAKLRKEWKVHILILDPFFLLHLEHQTAFEAFDHFHVIVRDKLFVRNETPLRAVKLSYSGESSCDFDT